MTVSWSHTQIEPFLFNESDAKLFSRGRGRFGASVSLELNPESPTIPGYGAGQ